MEILSSSTSQLVVKLIDGTVHVLSDLGLTSLLPEQATPEAINAVIAAPADASEAAPEPEATPEAAPDAPAPEAAPAADAPDAAPLPTADTPTD